MQIKYVGPKPIIKPGGISFDNEYDDKYTYLNIAVQLLKALDRDFFEDNTYNYETDSKRLNDEEILEGIKQYCTDAQNNVESFVAAAKAEIAEDIRRAKEDTALADDERSALLHNLEIMHNYRVQFATNDALYNSAVTALANRVKERHIDYIIVPMFQRFAEILHSVQETLTQQNALIDTKFDIYEENGRLLAKLQVKNR
jgi:hypothetical protein